MVVPSLNASHGFKRFIVSGHYCLTLAVLLTYGPFRERASKIPIAQSLPFFESITDYAGFEKMAGLVCLINAGIRFWRARAIDEGLLSVLRHAQLFIIVMSATADKFALLSYLLAFATILLLFPVPQIPWSGSSGGQSPLIEDLTPNSFREKVVGAGASSDVTYIVIFHSSWHTDSRALSPMLADMAARYSTDKIRFCKLDVGQFTHQAKLLDIEVSAWSKQLPTCILYDKGEEQMRVPKKMGGKVYGARCAAHDIAKAFELDMRFARQLQKGPPGTEAGSGSGKPQQGVAAGEASAAQAAESKKDQ